MIPKELFLSSLEKICMQRAKIEEFENALGKMCDGHIVFDRDNLYLEALLDLLKYTMKDKYNNIDWWLYEAPAAECYKIWWDEGDKEICRDLSSLGTLYDYLVEIAEEETE